MAAKAEPLTLSEHVVALMDRLDETERRVSLLEERLKRVRSAAAIEIACEKAERAPKAVPN